MSDGGYLTSLDLALLKEVFEETCQERNRTELPCRKSSGESAYGPFENGVQDKAGLLAIVAGKDRWAA